MKRKTPLYQLNQTDLIKHKHPDPIQALIEGVKERVDRRIADLESQLDKARSEMQ